MKASKALKISLAALIAACAIPVGTVFAAENTTDYPVETTDESGKTVQPFERELEIEDVTDYAVYGDNFAYASNLTITILSRDGSGDRKRITYTHEYSIEKLDYDDSGKLYFQNSSEISYLYGTPVVRQEHEYQSIDSYQPIIVDKTSYYTLNSESGELIYYKNGVPQPIDSGFSLIKKYGNFVYAIKDGAVPYVIDGQTAEPLDMFYTDFTGADNILCGDTAASLKADGYHVRTANIKSGKYYTQINPDMIGDGDADKFIQIRTQKAEGDKPCIVLCESGNTRVVATNDGMFITDKDSVRESSYSAPANDWPISSDNKKRMSAYAVEDVGVYASPFMCDGTKIATLKSGAENYVEVIERFELDFINTKFYRVRYEVRTIDENTGEIKTDTISGYVAANMLTPYSFAAEDNQPKPSGGDNFSYKTNVASVILAIVIIALVIIAIMYIMLIGSKKDKNKLNKKEKVKEQPKPAPVDDEEEE